MSLCSSIDILAMAFLDDELARVDRRELELHLLECARCKRHVDGLRTELGLVRRALAAPQLPGSQHVSIQRALDAEDHEAARLRRRGLLAWLLPGSATLASLIGLVMFVFVQPPPARSSETSAVPFAHEAVREPGRALLLDVRAQRGPWLQTTTFGEPGGRAIRYSDGKRRVHAIVLGDRR
jgi:anti-sigma factor RsiW